jgi:hypothetical protein
VFFGGGAIVGSQAATVDVFKLEGDIWTRLGNSDNLSVGRSQLAAATCGEYVLFGGGTIGNNSYSSVVDVFKLEGGSWKRVDTLDGADGLSEAQYGLAAATWGDYVLFGGGSVGYLNYSSTVDVFKLEGGSWTRVQQLTGTTNGLSEARYGLAAATWGDYVLFGGGYNSSNFLSRTVDVFKFSTEENKWKRFESLPDGLSRGRLGLAAATCGDYVLFGGGQEENSIDSAVVDVFKFNGAKWECLISLNDTTTGLSMERTRLAAATCGDYVLFGGGYRISIPNYPVEVDVFQVNG